MVRKVLASLGLSAVLSPFCLGQVTGDRVDLYFGDWHNAAAHKADGGLEERDILTRGDPQNPTQKGAVLRYMTGYDYATLPAHASTKATKLTGEQQIYFVESGQGTATAGGQTVELSRNIAVLDAGEPRVHAEEHRCSAAGDVCNQRTDASRLPSEYEHARPGREQAAN